MCKRFFLKGIVLANLLLISINCFSQGLSVNSTGSPADSSAMLDVSGVSKGVLINRMTTTERNAIVNPAQSLLIYNTTTQCFEFFESGTWHTIGCASTTPSPGCPGSVSFTYNGSAVTYGTVGGQNNTCWLDRNLGASQVATSIDDALSYGDLFEWGREDDGHQVRTSITTTVASSNSSPGHSKFIVGQPNWYSGPNPDNLWQGLTGINNPCPAGWRLPVISELDNERAGWGFLQNYNGGITSPLKLPSPGYRIYSNGTIYYEGDRGYYWSSTINVTDPDCLFFDDSFAYTGNALYRAQGNSVRCIMD